MTATPDRDSPEPPGSDPQAEQHADTRAPVRHSLEAERAIPSVNREQSLRSRMAGVVVTMTVAVVGIAFFYWYYGSAVAERRRAEEAERRAREARAAGDLRPPRLSMRTEPPIVPMPVSTAPPPQVMPVIPPTAPITAPPAAPPAVERDRLLAASVMLKAGTPTPALSAAAPLPFPVPASADSGTLPGAVPGGTASALAQSLRPTQTPSVRAQVLPDRRFLLPKGAFIDCTLETALDSTLPGLATCIAPVDIFSADGTIVLIERGTRFVGETRADVRPGQSRIGVLWNEARTPQGVSVSLASPGTDELGRTGLPGQVDRHFWERFGAAILVSMIDGTMQAIANAQRSGISGPVYNTGTPRDVMTEVLRGTINIPPTVTKNQGERIQILVARDVDFRTVYALQDTGR
ncbi:MAG: hypothetical protein RJA99_3335 [Pseudomonadota bacterium]|jgi:type IV secretion system protein VirB10